LIIVPSKQLYIDKYMCYLLNWTCYYEKMFLMCCYLRYEIWKYCYIKLRYFLLQDLFLSALGVKVKMFEYFAHCRNIDTCLCNQEPLWNRCCFKRDTNDVLNIIKKIHYFMYYSVRISQQTYFLIINVFVHVHIFHKLFIVALYFMHM